MIPSSRLLLLLALPLALTPVLRANLIVNGGFETGTNAGWTVVPADAGSYCIVTPTYESFGYTAQEGLFAVGFGAMEDTLDTIYQGFATDVGESYLFSFWVHNTAGWSGSRLLASWNSTYVSGYGSSPFQISPSQGDFPWQQYNFMQVASSAWTTIAFSGLSNSDWIMVDNVSVAVTPREVGGVDNGVAVPDTAPTAALLGLALAAAATLRRRLPGARLAA